MILDNVVDGRINGGGAVCTLHAPVIIVLCLHCLQTLVIVCNKHETVEASHNTIRINGKLVEVSPSYGYASEHGEFEHELYIRGRFIGHRHTFCYRHSNLKVLILEDDNL